ncbi:response regulator transcription factor [Occallatibacter riparius]|uniref:Response regulator transcription factor n=1 Tax=Occallatibacter riparius TaxID=1002689 RepID=A0A9J7BVS3_9BACT|nr:response regulator transcription factor [Occallatibacter riparius]
MPEGRKTRVLIVDDHPVLRDGILASIRAQSDMEVVGEATCGQEAISLFSQKRPDITLMDLRLPDMSGNDAIVQIRSTFPNARIIVLTTYQGDVQAIKAFKAGAMAYLLKSSLRKDLLNTIRSVLEGRKVIPPEIAAAMASHVADDELSARELQILRHVADGLSNKLIADRLSLSPDTVKSHLANVMAKLNANDRTHAVTIAVKRGYFDLDD